MRLGESAAVRCVCVYWTLGSLLFSQLSFGISFERIPLNSSDSEISRELLSDKWKSRITSYRSSSELNEIAEYVSSLLAELHKRRKHNQSKIESEFKNEIGRMSAHFRNLGESKKVDGPFGMRVRPEILYEWKLTDAVNKSEPPQDACHIICSFADKYKTWGYQHGQRANFTDLDTINDSWSLPLYAIEALFFSKANKLCPNQGANLKRAFGRWLNHPYVKYRHKESSRDDKFNQVLKAPANQYRTWGLAFSNAIFKELHRDPSLQSYLPSTLKIDPNLGGGTIAVDPDYLKRSADITERGLIHVFGLRGERNTGVGGSNLHFHMLGTLLSTVSAGEGASSTRTLVREMERLQSSHGASELQFPYTIDGRPPNTERSSAARGVPFRFAELKNLGYSKQRLDRLVKALMNFAIHSGALTIHVARNGVHQGGDGVAPYYWPPTLPTAAAALSLARHFAKENGDTQNLQRLDWAKSVFEKSITAQYDPSTSLFSNAGKRTYGANPRAWVNTFQAIGLMPACEESRGRTTMGAFDGLAEGEFLVAMNNSRQDDWIDIQRGSGVGVGKGNAQNLKDHGSGDADSGSGKEKDAATRRATDTRTPQQRFAEAFQSAKSLEEFITLYRFAKPYSDFFESKSKLKAALNAQDSDPKWQMLSEALWPKGPRRSQKVVEADNPLLQLLSNREFSLQTPEFLQKQFERYRIRVEDEDWGGLQEDLIDMLYSKREDQQKWLLEQLKSVELSESNDSPTDSRILAELRKVLLATQDRENIQDPILKQKILSRANESFRWNRNLKMAINAPDGWVNIETSTGPKKTKAQDWMREQIKEFGYDSLVRFANSAGGDTGNRTLKLLSLSSQPETKNAIHFSTGSHEIKIGDGGPSHSAKGDVRLEFQNEDADLTSQMKGFLPKHSDAWAKVEFFEPTKKRPVRATKANSFVLYATGEKAPKVAMRKDFVENTQKLSKWMKDFSDYIKKTKQQAAKKLKHNQGIQKNKVIAKFFADNRNEIASMLGPANQLLVHDTSKEYFLIKKLESSLGLPPNSLFDNPYAAEFGRTTDANGNERYFFRSHLGNDEKASSIGMDDNGNYFVTDNAIVQGGVMSSVVSALVATQGDKNTSKDSGGQVYFFGPNGLFQRSILSASKDGDKFDISYQGYVDDKRAWIGRIKSGPLFKEFYRPGPGNNRADIFQYETPPSAEQWFAQLAPQENSKDLEKNLLAHLQHFSKYPNIKKWIEQNKTDDLSLAMGFGAEDSRMPVLKQVVAKLNRKQEIVPPMPEKITKRQRAVPPIPENLKKEKKPKITRRDIGSSKPRAGSSPPSVGKGGPQMPKGKPLSQEERAKYEKAIRDYENLSYHVRGRNLGKRERFTEAAFSDVPIGGTGKIILGYFANDDETDLIQALEKEAAKHPLIEVRRYAWGSPEQKRFRSDISSIGFDGLGRKITRYGPPSFPPLKALRDLASGEELSRLKAFLEARRALNKNKLSSDAFRQGEKKNSPALSKEIKGYHSIIQNSSKCSKCHGKTSTPFPHFVRDWPTMEKKLLQDDPQAKQWLSKLNAKVVNGSMLHQAGLNKSLKGSSGESFHNFVKNQYERFIGNPSIRLGKAKENRALMIDPAKKQSYLKLINTANIDDKNIKNALQGFDALWDHKGAPPWSWAPEDGDGVGRGQRPVGDEPAGPPLPHLFQKIGDRFAWKEPFNLGFARDKDTEGLKSFFAIRFPRDENGRLIKGIRGKEMFVTVRDNDPDHETRSHTIRNNLHQPWASFPKGTRVFEVLYTESYGEPMIVDVLTREKRVSTDGKKASWIPDILRADSNPERIRQWVMKQTNYQSDPGLQAILRSLDSPIKDPVKSKLGTGDGGKPFVINGERTNQIPGSKSVVSATVDKSLTKRIRSELSLQSAAGSHGWAMEERGAFKGAHRGIRVDKDTCFSCHNSAGERFRDVFTQAFLDDTDVAAYGNMQGYDGVLSAPWFSPEDLKAYGEKETFDMRPEWAQFFEDYQPGKHSASTYRRTTSWIHNDRPLTSPE